MMNMNDIGFEIFNCIHCRLHKCFVNAKNITVGNIRIKFTVWPFWVSGESYSERHFERVKLDAVYGAIIRTNDSYFMFFVYCFCKITCVGAGTGSVKRENQKIEYLQFLVKHFSYYITRSYHAALRQEISRSIILGKIFCNKFFSSDVKFCKTYSSPFILLSTRLSTPIRTRQKSFVLIVFSIEFMPL